MKTRANAVIGDNRTRVFREIVPIIRRYSSDTELRNATSSNYYYHRCCCCCRSNFSRVLKFNDETFFFSRNSWLGGLAKYAEYRSFEVGTTRAVSRNNDNDNETPTSPTFDVRTIYVLGLRNGERGSRRPLENGVI